MLVGNQPLDVSNLLHVRREESGFAEAKVATYESRRVPPADKRSTAPFLDESEGPLHAPNAVLRLRQLKKTNSLYSKFSFSSVIRHSLLL